MSSYLINPNVLLLQYNVLILVNTSCGSKINVLKCHYLCQYHLLKPALGYILFHGFSVLANAHLITIEPWLLALNLCSHEVGV